MSAEPSSHAGRELRAHHLSPIEPGSVRDEGAVTGGVDRSLLFAHPLPVGEAVRAAPVEEVLGADRLDYRLPIGIHRLILADPTARRGMPGGKMRMRLPSLHAGPPRNPIDAFQGEEYEYD